MAPRRKTRPISAETYAQATVRLKEADNLLKSLGEYYKSERKIPTAVSPMYRPYFGNVMHISINCISVAVPCDGQLYSIPETFAVEVQRRVNAINDIITKQARMADISENVEKTPGELTLF